MPEEPIATERSLTGDDIISEILRNSDAGQFSIRRTVLLPCIYHVYFHPADYELIRPVIPALTAEARAALIERADELNRKARPSSVVKMLGLDSGKSLEYKILDPDWTIEFHPDAEEKLGRGDVEVFSELASAARPEFDGAMTRHVTRKRAGGELSSFAAPSSGTDATAQVTPPVTTADTVYGWLRYDIGGVPQVYPITKPQIVVGRGGKTFWVDVKVEAPPDVSREHCRIRRDPATGRFFLKDVSQFGTTLDGVRVPSSLSGERDTNMEVELPSRATISLADVFTLEFEASERR
jgi:hypothetical protein